MSITTGLRGPVAVLPLVGRQDSDEAYATGTLLSKLLADHLSGAGLGVVDSRVLLQHMAAHKYRLPLAGEHAESLKVELKLAAVVQGSYVLDNNGRLLGLQLRVDSPDSSPPPIEASTPLDAFPRFVEHISLALVEALGVSIDDTLRRRVKQISRPATFEALRQVALAQAAWGRGQHELALGAVTSALTLDESYEEALALQIAIARAAGDSDTVRAAFQKWSAGAAKSGRHGQGAERLMLLGHWLHERGDWTEARRVYDTARSLYERDGDEVGSARAQNNIANLDLLGGKLQSAIKVYRRSLRVFEMYAETQADSAAALLNLALSHRNLGQIDEAWIAVEQALTLARGLKDSRLEARCLAERAAIRHERDEWTQAGEDYQRAASLLGALGDAAGMAVVRTHQALLLKHQGNYQQAEALLLEAASTLGRQPHVHEQAVAWLNLADVYYGMQMPAEAWSYAERAHRVFERLGSDCAEQSGDLLAALARLPVNDETQPAAATGLPNDEGLYNGTELYDNELNNSEEDSGDGDAGVNSSVGRTPKM